MKSDRTYRELSDWIVHDVERIRVEEIERDLTHECNRVHHARLDDDEQDAPVAEV